MANSDKNIRITTSKNKATFPNIVFTGSAAGSSVLTLEILDDNTLSFTSNEGQVFSLDANLSTGTIWSVNDISGVPLLRASAGATIGLAEYSGVVGIGETLPNPGIYKLEVRGQVAFGSTADTNKHFIFNTSSSAVNTNSFQLRRGALAQFFEDGDVYKTTFRANASQAADANYIWPVAVPATGTSVLQSDTSGNLSWVGMAAGGGGGAGSGTVAIPGAQYQVAAYYWSATGASVSGSTTFTNNTATGVVDINHTTESTSTSTGALVVDGGAGIAKSLYVGTTLAVGAAPGYNIPNLLGSFVSTVNSYNQVVIQNKSNGTAASADFVLNNNLSTDTTYYANFGINSSTFSGTGSLALPNAAYVTSTTGDLVLGTTTANALRFVINAGTSDIFNIPSTGIAVSFFQPIDIKTGNNNNIRFWNTSNTFYTNFGAGSNTVNYDLFTPTAPVGAGLSVILVNSTGQMFFAPVVGIGVSPVGSNTAQLRRRRTITLQFCAGYTPASSGADTVVLKIPDSALDGITDVTYTLREFNVRVETPSSGSSRIMVERYNGTGAFAYAATGSSLIGGLGLTISGAGIYFTSTTSFAAGALVTSNDKLRLNWTLLNATHANFSVQLTMEQV